MKFRTKIAVYMIVFVTITFGIGGNLLVAMSFHDNLEQQKQSAKDSYQMILNIVSVANNVGEKTYYNNVLDVLEQLDENGGGSWVALRLRVGGKEIYKSNHFADSMEDSEVEEKEENYFLRIFKKENSHYLQITGNLKEGETILCLEGLYDISSVYNFRNNLQSIYRQLFFMVVIVGIFFSWFISGLVAKPIKELSQTARQIAKGNLSERSHIKEEDEIGQLAQDINYMTDELEHHIKELEVAMERQENFMGSFAHELKTPMTAIIGYADLLRSRELSETQRRESANYIFKEGKRLENLSLKLLDLLLTKNNPPERIPYSTDKLMQNMKRPLEEILSRKGIQLQLEWEKGECLLEPDLVSALLVNLVDNAGKSMEEKGVVSLEVKMTEDGCTIFVEDEGKGIPESEKKKITDAFYRVDKSRSRAEGGVGLGLALCKEIVDLHKGSITFEDREERGTRVVVSLRGGRV